MKRHPDGRFRGNRSPVQISNRLSIGLWVETETIRLKRKGVVSFATIAGFLTRAVSGEYVPTVSLPEGVTFPPNYTISGMGCWKAYRRRMEREPNLEAAEHRRLDTERCEEMFLSLQGGIHKGDPRSIEAGIRVLAHKADIKGLKTPPRVEMPGTQVNVLVEQHAEAQMRVDLNRLTIEELREYRRLEAKARGIPDLIEDHTIKTQQLTDIPDDSVPNGYSQNDNTRRLAKDDEPA